MGSLNVEEEYRRGVVRHNQQHHQAGENKGDHEGGEDQAGHAVGNVAGTGVVYRVVGHDARKNTLLLICASYVIAQLLQWIIPGSASRR